MSIAFACDCGRPLRVKEQLAGRKVRCPDCGSACPVPAATKSAEDEAFQAFLDDETDAGAKLDRAETRRTAEAIRATPPPPQAPPQPPPLQPAPPPPRSRKKEWDTSRSKKVSRDLRREDDGPRGVAVHPEILAGVGMMVGALVWFFAGLAADRIFIYPPILFCLGIGAIIRGFKGD
ncbi:MAG: hypothetical protein U0793_21695 [Gemmataceae bacterium]